MELRAGLQARLAAVLVLDRRPFLSLKLCQERLQHAALFELRSARRRGNAGRLLRW